ncbi:MAG: hypothetical protein V1648_04655 [Candidatus Aenigmatarchaeota archaeon]
MKKIILMVAMFVLLFSASAMAEDFKIIEVSKTSFACQIINTAPECQMVNNQFYVTVRSEANEIEADLELSCGKAEIKTYNDVCTRDENLHTCYFIIDPLVKLQSANPLECDLNLYFYRKFSNQSVGSDKYDGKIMITPVFENNALSIANQKKKLASDFVQVKNFDKESAFNLGVCSYLGTGFESELDSYESEFYKLGGAIMQTSSPAGKATGLLTNSSLLASAYAENGDAFLATALNNFITHGMMTGAYINQIIFNLNEGYIGGEIFENLNNDVESSCVKIGNEMDQVLNPNFFVMKKVKIIDCLEKRDFKNCWKKLEETKAFVNPSSSPGRAELRFYVNDRLFIDGANVCGNQTTIDIYYNGLSRFGIDNITIRGPGSQKFCENTIEVYGEYFESYTISNFLCGQGKPPEGSYAVEIDPGVFGQKLTYIFNYYEDPGKCKAKEDVIPV